MRARPAGPDPAAQDIALGTVTTSGRLCIHPGRRTRAAHRGVEYGRSRPFAVSGLYADRLGWRPERVPTPRYELLGGPAFRDWTYSTQQQAAQSVSALRTALAFDPQLHVLVMHGLYDLVTPYYASKMILDELPPAIAGRARLPAVPGGHMFYTRDASRVRLRNGGEALVRSAAAP